MGIREKLENLFAAAAFAEAGEADTAREIAAGDGKGASRKYELVCEGDECMATRAGA